MRLIFTTASLLGSLLWAGGGARGATLYFDAAGGTRNWDQLTTTAWSTLPGGPYALTWNGGLGTDAVFEGTGGIVNIQAAAPTAVSSLSFGTNGAQAYTVGGAGLNLAAAAAVTTNTNATIASVISGAGSSFAKRGAGTLTLTGANTYAGATAVEAGTLSVGNGGTAGSIAGGSAVSVAAGATMAWNNNNFTGGRTIANPISGAGTVLLQGQNATTALQTSVYTMSGNNAGFTGTWQLNRAIMWNNTSQSQLGAASTVEIQDRGTLAFNGGTYANNIVVQPNAGWHHNVGGDVVLGAIRLEGTNVLNGNIALNNTNHIVLGDNTGANSTVGGYGSGDHTLNGVLSGAGDFSMSRYTGWNGGSLAVVNIRLAGSSSNTYTGTTVVDGQGALASLWLQKTGGAVAIAGGNTVQFGNGTGGQANLRMGANEQFGTANGGVLMNWVTAAGNWGRFDLKGTTQTLAGLSSTPANASMVIQNQGTDAVDPGANATLTLNGSGTYAAYGYMRDQDNGGTTRKLNIVKSGTGYQAIGNQAPASISYSGTTVVNGGTLAHDTTLSSANAWNSAVTVNPGATFATTGTQPNQGAAGGTITLNNGGTLTHATTAANAWKVWSGVLTVNGAGNTINVDNTNTASNNLYFDAGIAGSGELTVRTTGGGNNGIVFRTQPGAYTGRLTLDGGTTFINGSAGRTLQNAAVNLQNGATLTSNGNWAGSAQNNAYFGAIDGAAGTTLAPQSIFHIGMNGADGKFSGDTAGAGNINKLGAGTQVLNGASSNTNGWLMASRGTLELASGFTRTSSNILYVGAFDQATFNDGGAPGAGIMRFTGGSFTTTASGNIPIHIGRSAGNAGVLQMDAGAITATGTGNVAVVGDNSAGTLNQTGGSINLGTAALVVSNQAGGAGSSANFSGGTFTTSGIWYNSVRSAAATTISGNADVSAGSFSFGHPGGTAATGTLNLSGGTLSSTNGMIYGLGTHSANLNGGTLRAGSNAFAWAHNANVTATIGPANIGFDSQAFNASTAQVLGGVGGITKTGSGTWTLTGTNAYTGPTTVNAGSLRAGAAAGGQAFGNLSAVSLADAAGASVDLNNFSQRIGSLAGGGAAGGNVTLGSATLTTGGDNTSTSFGGAISGTGGLVKTGGGTQTLTGNSSYTGATAVDAGRLRVNGSLGNTAVAVAGGATLEGTGRIAGAVTINAGGTLGPGNSPGAITLGSLTLNVGSLLAYEYGAPNVVGGPVNDLTHVTGNLTLGGTLNVTDGGAFAAMPGSYRVFNYGGTLIGNAASLALGSTPGYGPGDLAVQTVIPQQVNLIASQPGLPVTFWDGTQLANNGAIDGGTSTWNNARSNWTNTTGSINQRWIPGMAIFTGAAGTVTLDEHVDVKAMQFSSDGYVVTGGGKTIGLLGMPSGAPSLVRVDPGVTATIAAPLVGTGGLQKADIGTLVLSGANTYTGATQVTSGTLRAGAASALSAASAHRVDSGATLDLAGFSQTVSSLANSGTVSLLGTVPGTTLTVTGAYAGNNGTLRLGTTLDASGPSDRLVLDGAAASAGGRTIVQIANLGGLGARTTGNGIEVISARNGATTTAQSSKDAFSLAGAHVDAGAFEYRLYAADAAGAGENWYLRSEVPDPSNPFGPFNPGAPDILTYRAEVSLFAAVPGLMRQVDTAMLGNRHQRLGDDEPAGAGMHDSRRDRRAWGRVIAIDPDLRQSGAARPATGGRLTGVQAGIDLYADAAWHAGVYVGQLDGDARTSGFAGGRWGPVGSTDLRSRYLGAYGTWMGESGLYVDVVLQGGRHRYTAQPLSNLSAPGKGSSVLASLEAGKSFAIGDGGWKIEPQVQLIRQHLSVDDATISAALVQQDLHDGWIARAGVRIKGELRTAIGTLQPYGRFNVYRATGGKDITRFIGPAAATDIATRTGYTSTELAGGFTLALSPTTGVYGEVGKLFGSGSYKVKSGVQGSAGVRVRW
ncbi:autotransporter outer membrane beta-barrel domain-containing protein [Variovorax sp. WS11]|uniref:autotransporter outer membrane beta-barrel domain-containing protein n=1 Tax=Variovorax sp. WS11 TaxID=1105204 RepID=UPI0013D9732F|nr:autotransporter outer membrane beta-barrel domain-containing protein [Variovorax sp. WS11]NDZ15982.1 autotransporter outer membrane beta-barrel domain-containing protein [Variovorax sp. WS11]